ncbi:MAG: hypothetical protein HQ541_05005, partial [Mariniphaga sp.]|nr:hypothetical protein [Mariniphaga sp.]
IIYINKGEETLRYNILKILRQFAQQKLQSRKEESKVKERHLNYYLNLAEKAYKEQHESSHIWLTKLKQENDNLISALNWADMNCPEEFRILAGYLSWYWVFVSNLLLGRQYLERAILKGTEQTEIHARILYGLGNLTYLFKDRNNVIDLLSESLSLWQRFKNPFEEALVLGILSMSYQSILKEHEEAIQFSERCLERAKEVGKPGIMNFALRWICQAMVHSRKFEQALPYVEEFLASSESLNSLMSISAALHFHSDCALGLKDFPEAEKRYRLATKTAKKYGIVFNSYAEFTGDRLCSFRSATMGQIHSFERGSSCQF